MRVLAVVFVGCWVLIGCVGFWLLGWLLCWIFGLLGVEFVGVGCWLLGLLRFVGVGCGYTLSIPNKKFVSSMIYMQLTVSLSTLIVQIGFPVDTSHDLITCGEHVNIFASVFGARFSENT